MSGDVGRATEVLRRHGQTFELVLDLLVQNVMGRRFWLMRPVVGYQLFMRGRWGFRSLL